MTGRSADETAALIKRLRTRVDVRYVNLAVMCLAMGSVAFANDLFTLGFFLYMLTLISVLFRYQDAQYANHLESDEKKRVARAHEMEALDAWHDRQMEKLDEQTKALAAVTEKVLEKLDEQRRAIENLSGQEDSAQKKDLQ